MFDPEEIALNAKGMLSERQANLVAQILRYRQIGWGCAVLAFAGSPVFMLSVGIANDMPFTQEYLFSMGAGVLLLLLILSLFRLYDQIRIADLRHRRIRTVEGVAKTQIRNFRMRGGSNLPRFELTINGVLFFMTTNHDLMAFEDGVNYRVYYLPNTPANLLLSAEPI